MALPHTKTSGAARMAVVYITVGAIMDVWTVLWLVWMNRHPPQGDGPFFWCYGFLLTGATLILIGLALGRIGQSARTAEAPPDTTNQDGAAAAQQTTAAPVAAAVAPMTTPAMPMNGASPVAAAQPVARPVGTFPMR